MSRRQRYAVKLLSIGILLAFGMLYLPTGSIWQSESPNSEQQLLRQEIAQFLGQSLVNVTIRPFPGSSEEFAYSVDEPAVLRQFEDAARSADFQPVSSHSGSIFEAVFILDNGTQTMSLLATVHNYEKDDLYISKSVSWRTAREETMRPKREKIRLKGMSDWAINLAPSALRK